MRYGVYKALNPSPSLTKALADNTCIDLTTSKADALKSMKNASNASINVRVFIRRQDGVIIASAINGRCSHYHQ